MEGASLASRGCERWFGLGFDPGQNGPQLQFHLAKLGVSFRQKRTKCHQARDCWWPTCLFISVLPFYFLIWDGRSTGTKTVRHQHITLLSVNCPHLHLPLGGSIIAPSTFPTFCCSQLPSEVGRVSFPSRLSELLRLGRVLKNCSARRALGDFASPRQPLSQHGPSPSLISNLEGKAKVEFFL